MIKVNAFNQEIWIVCLQLMDFHLSALPVRSLVFLGPNGAGKSTTMKMITGFVPPTSGQITVAGYDVATDSLAARKCMGYLPEGARQVIRI